MDIQDILNDFFGNYNKLQKISTHKHSELSKVDCELSDFYHKIEGLHLSHNTQGHGLILQLQDILDRRRQLKRDTILIRSFLDSTQGSMDKAKTKGVNALEKHNKIMKQLKNNSKKVKKN